MTLPCIDCLVLPICKSKYKELYNDPSSELYQDQYACENTLADKCILLQNFLLDNISGDKIGMIIKNGRTFRNFINS